MLNNTIKHKRFKTKPRETSRFCETQKNTLFIGGIPQDTTQKELIRVFSRFGDIQKTFIPRQPNHQDLKGFAFIAFRTEKGLKQALETSGFKIRGKLVSLKKCYAPAKAKKKVKENQDKGLFLSGLFSSVKEEDIQLALSPFGVVESVRVMIDKDNKTCKGYGFATMASKEGQRRAVNEKIVDIGGKLIKITKLDKSKKNQPHTNVKKEGSKQESDEKKVKKNNQIKSE